MIMNEVIKQKASGVVGFLEGALDNVLLALSEGKSPENIAAYIVGELRKSEDMYQDMMTDLVSFDEFHNRHATVDNFTVLIP
jgi:hypothetical protein